MSKARILIVEDEAIIAMNAARMLRKGGYEVAGTATDGAEAVAKARELLPDLVLMDIMLAGPMDGIDASIQIRRDRDIPIVFITGHSDDITLDRARETEPQGYLLKPVDENELYTTLAIVLHKHEADRKVRESEIRFRELFMEMLDGYGLHEMLYDGAGNPSDYRFLAVNPSFEKLTGLKAADIVGKTVTQVFPEIDRFWIDTYGRVAATGEPAFFEQFFSQLGRHYQVRAFRPMEGHFVTVFQDISDRKKHEEEMYDKNRELEDINAKLRQSYLELEAAHEEMEAAYEEQEATSEELARSNRDLEKAHRDLAESNHRMKALLGAIPDLLFEFDREGRIYDYRSSDPTALYTPPEFFLGKRVPEILPADAAAVIMKAVEEADRNGQSRGHDYRLVMGGKKRSFELSVEKMKRSSAESPRFVALAHENTARLAAQAGLRQSEEKFRTLFETMAQGVVYQASDGKIISANPAAERILGLTLEQMQGLTSMDPRWHAIREDGTNLPGSDHPAMVALRTKKEMNDFVMGVYNPLNDDYRWLLISAVPQFREGREEPYQVYTTFTDITERKRMGTLLSESEAMYRSLFENMLNGFAYCQMHFVGDDPADFTYLAVNRAFEAQTGLKNVVNRKVTEVIPGIRESDPGLFEIYGRVARTGIPEQFETFVKALGMWFSVSVYSPKKEHFVAVFDVITERKAAEERIQATLVERETLLRELYHRTKNNMQVICSLLDLQAEQTNDGAVLSAFRDMGNRIRSMALVHQKLYQSQNLSQINLGEYLRDLADLLFANYHMTAQEVTLAANLADIPVNIDTAIPCGLIVNELVSNALKHGFKKRGGELKLSCAEEAGGGLVIEVSDNGAGVPAGFDFKECTSLGMQTVITLTEQQLSGAIESRGGVDGVSHRIIIPPARKY